MDAPHKHCERCKHNVLKGDIWMNLGIDVGNGYVKLCNGKLFPSRVKIGEKLGIGKQTKNVHYVEYKENQYVVGEGALIVGEHKHGTFEYELLLMTGIALSSNDDFIQGNICVGLPWENFARQKKQLKERILAIGQQHITVDGISKNVCIDKCQVFVEGAYPILTGHDEHCLVIDMGTGTINISEWVDGEHKSHATYTEAMLMLYSKAASALNEEYGTKFKPMDIEKLLDKVEIPVFGEKKNITFIRAIIQNGITEMCSYINNKFNIETVENIYLIGGGGGDTLNYWKNNYPIIKLVSDNQFINVKVFGDVAKEAFGENA